MKTFKVTKSTATVAALVLSVGVGLAIGASEVQQAVADDAGTGSGEPLVIAAKRVPTQAVVPNLIGKDKAQTEKALAEAGLTLGEVQFTTSEKGKPSTVVKQRPTAKTTVAKGSAVNVVVLLRAAPKVSPKIVQRGEKVFMEFPDTVKDVIISDEKGKKLQQFNKGKRLEITESAVATKGGCIKVNWKSSPTKKVYLPWPPPGRKALEIDHFADVDLSHLSREDLLRKESRLKELAELPHGVVIIGDDTTIENGEPANNDINGATQISRGQYTGELSSNDPSDYLKIQVTSHHPGSLVIVTVISGDVNLSLYGPNKASLLTIGNKGWIALVKQKSCYIKVWPGSSGTIQYTIAVAIREIEDPYEPNMELSQATSTTLNNPIQACLCYLMDQTDWDWSGRIDRYKVNITQCKHVRILFHNFPPTMSTWVRFESPDGTMLGQEFVDDGTADFLVDLCDGDFSSGWHNIMIGVAPNIDPYGAGDPPDNYKPYELLVQEIP